MFRREQVTIVMRTSKDEEEEKTNIASTDQSSSAAARAAFLSVDECSSNGRSARRHLLNAMIVYGIYHYLKRSR